MQFTKDLCEKWAKNKKINPLTGRPLDKEAKNGLYKKFEQAHKQFTKKMRGGEEFWEMEKIESAYILGNKFAKFLLRSKQTPANHHVFIQNQIDASILPQFKFKFNNYVDSKNFYDKYGSPPPREIASNNGPFIPFPHGPFETPLNIPK